MIRRSAGVIAAIAGAAMLVALAAQPAAGQGPASRALPRTPDGKPDFSGIWEVMSKANYNIEPHSASRGVPAGAGVVEGGELPFQSVYAAVADEPGVLPSHGAEFPTARLRVLRVCAGRCTDRPDQVMPFVIFAFFVV